MTWTTALATLSMCLVCFLGIKPAFAASDPPKKSHRANAFFAMDTGTKDANHVAAKAQAAMLKELGYAGIGYSGFDGIPEMLKELDAQGLHMFTVYFSGEVNPDGSQYDPLLKEGVKALKGRDTILWITISSKVFKPSSPEGDVQAVAMLRAISDSAAASGLRVALYPHTNCWLEKVEDAVRVAKKVDRKNVGVTFNLCHWLNAGKGQDMEQLMRIALPHLFAVTINGADSEGGWDKLIQPLDQGSFDVRGFLMTLKELGYTGPIGLQGYGIPGDVHENLKRSMAAWKKLTEE